jgi:hypothetical protein
MINLTAHVVEFEKDNRYKVTIEGVWSGFTSIDGLEDDSVLSFHRALAGIVEVFLSDNYDINMVAKSRSKEGRPCRKYTVSIDNGD